MTTTKSHADLTADDRKVLTVNINHGESSLRSLNPIAIVPTTAPLSLGFEED